MEDGILIYVEEQHADKFDDIAANHSQWRAVARDLLASASLLWPHVDKGFEEHLRKPLLRPPAEGLRHRGAFYLLAGMAVENFLKALIVLDHEKSHQKSRGWYGEQKREPVAEIERRPHQNPERHEWDNCDHDLDDTTAIAGLPVGRENLRPGARIRCGCG
jgi:hypothetical protein